MNRNEMLSSELQRDIEKILGKEISLSRFHTVEVFMDFTDSDLCDFRIMFAMNERLVIPYLLFLMKNDIPFSMIMSFCGVVIQQNVAVKDWIENLPAPLKLKLDNRGK